MYYDTAIDENHSTRFYYQAGTHNLNLKSLSLRIWVSLGPDGQTLIDGKTNNKGILGDRYVELVIIQLYHNWLMDKTLCLASPRNNNALNAKDFYNPAKIYIPKLARTFDTLIAYDYVDSASHSHSDNPNAENKTSRIRASKKLHELFVDLDATEFDVDKHKGDKLILLRQGEVDAWGKPKKDSKGKKVSIELPYDETTPHVAEKLAVLREYNNLLARTHVDIASLEVPYVVRERINSRTKKVTQQLIPVDQNSKFVRRIFSRGSWTDNGRFYGPFWQQVGDKDENKYRRNIRINGQATVELDYSSLHPNILTVEQGLPPIADVYTLDAQIIPRFNMKQQRSILKLMVLVLLNASSTSKAFFAVTDKLKDMKEKDPTLGSLKYKEYESYLEAFVQKHPHLENYIGADQGSALMYKDSQIIEHIINQTTAKNIPILTVHDSIICIEEHQIFVTEAMQLATSVIVGTTLSFDANRTTMSQAQGAARFKDRDYTDSQMQHAISKLPTTTTQRHEDNYRNFKQHLSYRRSSNNLTSEQTIKETISQGIEEGEIITDRNVWSNIFKGK